MPKRLILLVVILVITISILIFVKYAYRTSSPQIRTSEAKNSKVPKSTALLSLFPDPLTATATESASINVVLESPRQVDLVQLEIAYNPALIYNLSIFPGNYFSNPSIILENIDYKNGRVSYALKGEDVNPSSNIVAVISFNSSAYGIQKESEISFLPKTLIKKDNETIKLDLVNNAKVIFKPVFYPLPFSSTPSAVLQ